MQQSSARRSDVSIVEAVLDAIEGGDYPELKRFEREFRELHQALLSGEAEEKLQSLLRQHDRLFEETIHAVASQTIRFIESELARFKEIKAGRELTEQEKRYGNETLGGLVAGLAELTGLRPPAEGPERLERGQ